MFIQGATGGTGGGTTITSGTDTFDFGSAPGGNAASTTITGQAGIVAGSSAGRGSSTSPARTTTPRSTRSCR